MTVKRKQLDVKASYVGGPNWLLHIGLRQVKQGE